LPTLWLDSVTEIRDVTNGSIVIALDDVQTAKTSRFRAGCLRRSSSWPSSSIVELDIVHGYDTCPPELLALAATLCRSITRDQSIRQRAAGPFSVTYDSSANELVANPLLARYTIPPRA
jgi:hypothetical protein